MKLLYSVLLPEAAQTAQRDELAAILTEEGVLGGEAVVEQLATESADVSLEGQYRYGEFYSRLLANELEGLADSSWDAVPLSRQGSPSETDGYYEIESASVDPAHAASEGVIQWTLDLAAVGTHETHWLAVDTTPVQVDHEYGNTLDPLVAIPSAAVKPRWYNPDPSSGAVAPAGDPVETVATEHGDVDRYSVDAGEQAVDTTDSEHGPTLLYELSYSEEGVVDPVVWDDHGHAEKLLESDGDTVRQWQHVFATSHEYVGAPVLDSGRLRVFVDEADGSLDAETWDDDAGEWTSVGLDWSATDWQLYDWDVEAVSPTVVRSQASFLHPDDGLYALDAALHRGGDTVQWSIPTGEDPPIPSGLESVLAPVASGVIVDAQPERALVRRSAVRR